MKLTKVISVIGLLAMIGCAHGKMGNVAAPLATGALNKSEMIYVLPVDGDNIQMSGDKSKDAATVNKIKSEIHSRYAGEIVRELVAQGFTASAVEKRPAKGKVLTGKVTHIENGSAAARYFVGMGAGSANMFTDFDLTDSGKSIARFQVIGTSGGSSKMGSFLENHIMDSAKKTAEYLFNANTGKEMK